MLDGGRKGETATRELAPYREPFRTAIVVATGSAFIATVAIVTAGAVLGTLLGFDVPPGGADLSTR